jgi:hypothetical protein
MRITLVGVLAVAGVAVVIALVWASLNRTVSQNPVTPSPEPDPDKSSPVFKQFGQDRPYPGF